MSMIQHGLLPDIPLVKIQPSKPALVRDFSNRKLVGKVLQLGAGRQSSCIAEMIVEGELPRVDLVVFADTGDEPTWVYEQVWYLAGRLGSVGIPLMLVKKQGANSLVEEAKNTVGRRFAAMPLYVGTRGKRQGILKRQCTNEWKIIPSDHCLRDWLLQCGHAVRRSDGARMVKPSVYIEQWYGISADEPWRMKARGLNWQRAVYPLIERQMTTQACLKWLEARALPVPKKSSCRVCPYHDDHYWLDLKKNWPVDFEHACAFDDWLRSPEAQLTKMIKRLVYECYLHESCLPLREIDFEERLETKRRGRVSPFQRELIGTCASDGGFSCLS